jgi:UDP-3-O-[3-hydroxymyristoyl] glucosamine N-acyltransferase
MSGDVEVVIKGAASLAEATAGEITFYGNPRYLAAFRKTRASAAFVPQDFTEQIVDGQIRVENPTKAFEQVVLRFAPQPISFAPGIHSSAVVAPGVSLGKDVSVGAYAVVEPGVEIGDGRAGRRAQLCRARDDDRRGILDLSQRHEFVNAPDRRTRHYSQWHRDRLGRLWF